MFNNKGKRTFLDYATITPVDLEVAKEMEKVQKNFWANPSSLHKEGEEAKSMLDESRVRVARALHCKANEVFFTSGGTESLNLAILGVVKFFQGSPLKTLAPKGDPLIPHIITSTIEHPAVLEPIKSLLEKKQIEVSFITPDKKGIIKPESIKKEIKKNTILVAIQHANNEIGTIQPIAKISKIIKEHKLKAQSSKIQPPYLLVDASQSTLYENVSLERLGADLLVLDGIKIYGPRGMGVLVVKTRTKISPITFGGGQEGGLRPGTENVVGAVGFAKALEIAVQKREKESKRLTKLRDYFTKEITSEIPRVSLNGGLENRLPNNINICFQGFALDSEFLVIKLDTMGFAVSAASACHALSLENSSYVVEAVSGEECASSSLRITLGRDTKKTDLDKLIEALKKIIK